MNTDYENIEELIASKLNQELSPAENDLFEKWIQNTDNQTLFEKTKKIHDGLKSIQPLNQSNRDDSWQRIRRKIQINMLRKYSKEFLKYAALLTIAFVAGYYFQLPTQPAEQKVQYAEIEVKYGQTGHLKLFDGTEVWLNSGSTFRYPNRFNQDERNVYLNGEAYFKVSHNQQLPFKVKTSNLEVKVLGTSFNISAYSKDSVQSVVLVEGKVWLNNLKGEKLRELNPGQIGIKNGSNTAILVQDVDPYFYTSWKDGKVIFDGERLGDIAIKMERWYNVKINFKDNQLKNYKLTGTILRNKPIDQTIMAMELLAPIRFNYHVNADKRDEITVVKR